MLFDDDDRLTLRATAFLQGLTGTGRLTFPVSTFEKEARGDWTPVGVGGDQVVRLAPASGSFRRLLTSAWHGRSGIVLLSTDDATSARRMFDDASFSWDMQTQFALISPRDQEPPAVPSYEVATQLFEPTWAGALSHLAGVDAILRPGVDGDLVGILSRTESIEAGIVGAVMQAASASSLGFALIGEDEFADCLALEES